MLRSLALPAKNRQALGYLKIIKSALVCDCKMNLSFQSIFSLGGGGGNGKQLL